MQTNGQTYSVHSHQSECGWANHPADCRCDTYEGHSAHLDEIQSAPEGYQTVA